MPEQKGEIMFGITAEEFELLKPIVLKMNEAAEADDRPRYRFLEMRGFVTADNETELKQLQNNVIRRGDMCYVIKNYTDSTKYYRLAATLWNMRQRMIKANPKNKEVASHDPA